MKSVADGAWQENKANNNNKNITVHPVHKIKTKFRQVAVRMSVRL